ncbi:PREDICTED: plant UBX domain-containing protein 7 isoform X2 [Ipomoea nil]|uniref:plant UBX domain-containing protein 7 isoform X2 n=1 Tax=Ipomoea nil TaxID=35883 RepID=UPI00090084E8|nr:PREDICTED: plant UBX domain-containing protein 7 isoform X2 [Ipomoea nil]
MDGALSASEQQTLVASFLEIAVGQSADTARQFLQATSWKLEEALQLFYVGNDGGVAAPSSYSPLENTAPLPDPSLSGSIKGSGDESEKQGDRDEVRPPLPVIRDVLYDTAVIRGLPAMGGSAHEARSVVPFRNFEQEMKHPGVWETDKASNSADNLASLYRPPFALMYHGSFEKAKDAARVQNKWLLVNLQSTREFSSHMLNRDTWANEAVSQTIKTNFIFWQVYDDTEEGSKVRTYYKLDSIPVVLVVDPITGQKMRSWRGMVQPETLLEDLLPFMDGSPSDHVSLSHKRPRESPQAPPLHKDDAKEEDEELLQALAASMEGMKDTNVDALKESSESDVLGKETNVVKKPVYPPLPEEPKGDKNLVCRVGIRLPDGRRLQRNFLRSDPIQLLWSFCSSHLEETDAKPFRLTQAIPGATSSLDFESNLTFEESGLANSMISVTWD